MDGLRVSRGITPETTDAVAGLLLAAFPLKVRHELAPSTPEQGCRLIAASIEPSLGWVAFGSGGSALGVIGVDTREARFQRHRYRVLAREFGYAAAIPRWLMATVEHVFTRPQRRQWRVAVLAVSEEAQGLGVGTRLLDAVIDSAREADMRTVGLEVVDSNDRALRLYERMGFRRAFTLPTGWVTSRAGYRAVRFMVLDLREATVSA
jgi:ribosomal protein S18 acetylase RimI-like enzyme